MKKQHILTLVLLISFVSFSGFVEAASPIFIIKIWPLIVRQNDEIVITIKGIGFTEGTRVDMGTGVQVIATSVTSNEMSILVAINAEAKVGFRRVVLTNPDGKKAVKLCGLLILRCKDECQYKGNVIPIHDKDSGEYRTDCTSAACHQKILSETSLDNATPSFHVLKVKQLNVIPGNTDDEKCLYCHNDTDLVEHSAGNLRRNVDILLCTLCHTGTFYK